MWKWQQGNETNSQGAYADVSFFLFAAVVVSNWSHLREHQPQPSALECREEKKS
jgi:hypothetical protein